MDKSHCHTGSNNKQVILYQTNFYPKFHQMYCHNTRLIPTIPLKIISFIFYFLFIYPYSEILLNKKEGEVINA
jgi:hypothetical protein